MDNSYWVTWGKESNGLFVQVSLRSEGGNLRNGKVGYGCLDKISKGGVVVVRVGERVREVDVARGSRVVGDNGQGGDGDGNGFREISFAT
ncbi:hypothetical protein Pyn_41078 [Prunus yedoensis var. nudiflora]|uniref:Uncharacterized protein n=1 Tax=Prunus yedoensis var. nudiflora TaxID=2094558 RepID=A0A314UQR7_PRUYE|nr:hypothetical protein Pyn_41078 [Prunus yedoensis var. nudiflora]